MNELMRWLRALPRSVEDGCAALRDLLLWGQVYPRTLDVATLRRMRGPGYREEWRPWAAKKEGPDG